MKYIFLFQWLAISAFFFQQTPKDEPDSCSREHACECHKSCDRNADPNKSEDPKCKSYCKPGKCTCRPKCAT